jgi:GNAT superfamily N-acetyltransferase
MVVSLNSGTITIRPMNHDDIPLGMKLKSFTGWNQVEDDWKMFLDAGDNNFVAEFKGNAVGTVTTIPYSDHFSWIGMVLVDPAARRKGIGTALLIRAMEESRPYGPVRLDATADGYELYKTLGFIKEYELLRLVRRSGPFKGKDKSVIRQINPNNLNEAINYDTPVFDADRSYILNSLYKRNPEYAISHGREKSLEGYCLGRSGSHYEQIGPIVADTEAIAKDLMMAVLEKCSQLDVVVDAFPDKPGWISFLEHNGFTRQRLFIRMCLGELRYPGITEKQFAIAGPEIG